MANDCLVTKLKGVVDNDNLNKLGEVRMMVKLDGSSCIPRTNSFFTGDKTPFEITLLDDAVTFTSASGDAQIIDSKHGIATGRYLGSSGNALTTSADADSWINIAIKSKYDVGVLGSYVKDVQVSEFRYSYNIKAVRSTPFCPKYGTLKDLSKITSLEEIETWGLREGYALHGAMSDLGVLTNLTIMTIGKAFSYYQNPSTGSWDDFVVAQRNNGRTICDGITLPNAKYCYVPFGSRDTIIVGGETESGILKWDADKISIQFDTSLKVLTIGYTAEQAASAFSGYEVIMCDPS